VNLIDCGKVVSVSLRIFAWRIPQTEEPGRLQSMGSQTVGHDGVTNATTLISD